MNILLIDDDQATLQSVSMFITDLGHHVKTAVNGEEGLRLFNSDDFQLILSDITMPKKDGFDVLQTVNESETADMVDVVFITGNGNVDTAIRAMREGAYDYLLKPLNIEELSLVIERVSEHLSLKHDNMELTEHFDERVRERINETENKLEHYRKVVKESIGLDILIHSKKLGEVFELAEKFHNSPSIPVLVEGETGTGKDLLARFIHYGPEMASKPFVALNCGAIPTDLFESELFGHEAGAFTGANTRSKKGQLELAEDGTLLLDEIGDMPLAAQVKLLRVLDNNEYYRVGGVKRLQFNARVIASTNLSLKKQIANGKFRSDLYHRLNVGYIIIPPLRERREEIIPLAYDFLIRANKRHGKTVSSLSEDAEILLKNFTWPGNVRQLQNAIERVVLLYDDLEIGAERFAFLHESEGGEEQGIAANQAVSPTKPHIPAEGIDLDEVINSYIEEAMKLSGGKKTTAAKLLNISPRTISRRLERNDSN